MPYNPNTLPRSSIDDRNRVLGVGRPGLQNVEDKRFVAAAVGAETPIANTTSKKLDNDDANNKNSVENKVYYYPESFGNLGPRSFIDEHEVPRHALKITILDYSGSKMLATERARKLANSDLKDIGFIDQAVANNTLGIGNLAGITDWTLGLDSQPVKGFFFDTPPKIDSTTTVSNVGLADEINAMIYLYATSDNLRYNYKLNWQEKNVTGITSNLINGISEAMNSDSNIFGTAWESIKSALGIGGAELLRILRDTSNPLGPLIAEKIKQVPAENFAYLFKNVERRAFNVNVAFQAKSDREMRMIAKIINAIKHYSMPSRPGYGPLMTFPSMFLLENLTYVEGKGWVENLYLPRYKVCSCSQVQVQYDNNGSVVTHPIMAESKEGGVFKSPVRIDMALTFTELQILTREDITNPKEFFTADSSGRSYY